MDVGVVNRREVTQKKQVVDDRNQGPKEDCANSGYRAGQHCNEGEYEQIYRALASHGAICLPKTIVREKCRALQNSLPPVRMQARYYPADGLVKTVFERNTVIQYLKDTSYRGGEMFGNLRLRLSGCISCSDTADRRQVCDGGLLWKGRTPTAFKRYDSSSGMGSL
jgi:hypothetical protein